MDKTLETLVATENQQEANEVMLFLDEIATVDTKDFLTFVQGIRFARMAMGVSDNQSKY